MGNATGGHFRYRRIVLLQQLVPCLWRPPHRIFLHPRTQPSTWCSGHHNRPSPGIRWSLGVCSARRARGQKFRDRRQVDRVHLGGCTISAVIVIQQSHTQTCGCSHRPPREPCLMSTCRAWVSTQASPEGGVFRRLWLVPAEASLDVPTKSLATGLPIKSHVFERPVLSSMRCLFLCHKDFLQGQNAKVL
ncbi:unnamed protein product [Ectocarpus sp. 4 AP-2014]